MIVPFEKKFPQIGSGVFIAPTATVIGEVHLGEASSVWYGCVLRGDVHKISVGNRTNIQDLTVVHVTNGIYSTEIGDEVTVGHRAVIHGCKISNRVLVGIGSIILDGAEIADNVVIAAGTLVPPGMKIDSGVMVMGSPAKIKRDLTPQELQGLALSAEHYVKLAGRHQKI